MTAIYSNDAIVTQIDDGTPGGEGDYPEYTSSSMPSVMLGMLNHLDVRDGHRVPSVCTPVHGPGQGTMSPCSLGTAPSAIRLGHIPKQLSL